MKTELVKLAGGILLGSTMLVVLTACGSAASSAPAQVNSPTVMPERTAAPAPTANAAQPTSSQPATKPGNNANDELLAQGKLVFEKTAGGVGCAYCHGLDGKGQGPSGLGAPDNRGASEGKVRAALAGAVPVMSFIKLTEDEIAAVVAYLRYLGEQP